MTLQKTPWNISIHSFVSLRKITMNSNQDWIRSSLPIPPLNPTSIDSDSNRVLTHSRCIIWKLSGTFFVRVIRDIYLIFRVRHSHAPSAFQFIFYYLEDPGLLKDKYGQRRCRIPAGQWSTLIDFLGLWTLMTAVGRKSFEIYVDEMKKMVRLKMHAGTDSHTSGLR